MKYLRWAALVALISATGGPVLADEPPERPWKAAATAFLYVLPEQPNFVMVTAPGDIRWFHLEGRYNYEALDSGSAFAGINAGWGRELRLKITPMIGGVFGAVDGLVPALRWTLTWWKLDLYSESEYVIDFHDAGDSFFYNWSELGFTPLDWLRFGAAIQRSAIFMMSLDIQRGLFVAATIRFVTVSIYEFNLGWTSPTWVFALGVSF